MKRLWSVCLSFLLLFAWAVPAFAVIPITIEAPLEGAVVKSPVFFNAYPRGGGGVQWLRLEVARGKNATTGFMEVPIDQILVPETNRVDKHFWNAEGWNPGPYTLRFSTYRPDTKELVTQGTRNIVLEGPDYTPKVSLVAPATLSGSVVIHGDVTDADLDTWSLEAIDSSGKATLLAGGRHSASFPVLVDAGVLADGSYTLRLTAIDSVGQAATAEQNVQVKNPAPTVALSLVSVDPVMTFVPIPFASTTPAKVTVTVAGADGRTITDGEAKGTAPVRVPVSFRGVAPGEYTASVTVRDLYGRTGSDTFTVLVREPAPAARLERVDSPASQYLMAISFPHRTEISRIEIERTDRYGTTVEDWQPREGAARQTLTGRVESEGITTYRVILHLPDGRVSESEELVFLVDREPPRLGSVSVAPVDGVGLNMHWAPATDTAGIKAYEVVLVEGAAERTLATLSPQTLQFGFGLPEGEYKAYLVAVDLGGHRTNSDLLSFRVQTGAVAMMMGGYYLQTDQPGFVEDGRTWVPLRFFAQALGYTIAWDGVKQTATITDPVAKLTVVATVGDKRLQISGPDGPMTVEIAAAPRLFGGRMLVPLRDLVQAFGVRVQWHGETQTVELIGK
ncbi:MAG TPA: copper amine oxidase N-terminal domain-containing protein [Symbiobacteriaceae bacterium]|nr:copper amine oxidase N-terminal domain-containing protein [Symbiobacteriaceae bacterium]